MKFFIDTADITEIKELNELGIVGGVTTNPTLIAKVNADLKTRIKEISDTVSGPVSAEVTTTTVPEMIAEAKELNSLGDNIVIKVPINVEGLMVVKELTKLGIKTNVTLIFSLEQAMLAASAGATYVSPFLGRLDDIGEDGAALLDDICYAFSVNDIETKVISASIRNAEHVIRSAFAGADYATVPPNVVYELLKHPLTDKGIELFNADIAKMKNN